MSLRSIQDDDITISKLDHDVLIAIDSFLRLNNRVYLPVRLTGKEEGSRVLLVETGLQGLRRIERNLGEASEDSSFCSLD